MRKAFVITFIAILCLVAAPMSAIAQDGGALAIQGQQQSNNGFNNGQDQNQGQGQDQGQNQNQAVGLNDIGNIKDSFNSQGMRGFAIPGEVGYGFMPNYYQPGTPSGTFTPIQSLIVYSDTFTEGALKSILKKAERAKGEFKLADAVTAEPKLASDGETRFIKIIVTLIAKDGSVKKVENADFRGFVNAWSKHPDTSMDEVMAKAALVALENGCNVIQFTSQGFRRDTHSSGQGVGIAWTGATISGTQMGSQNGTVGAGSSWGHAGMRDKPWLQAFGLVDAELTYQLAEVATPETESDQTGNHTAKGSTQD